MTAGRCAASNSFSGDSAVPGEAEGDLLFSSEPLSLWGGYDAESGEVIDRRHPLSGEHGGGRILAIPATRGSSTTAAVLLEAIRRGTAPAALITRGRDPFLALAAIVALELYGRAPPVVALSSADFGRLAAARRARITRDGRVTVS